MLGTHIRGAISWLVDVHDFSRNTKTRCVLGVSADSIVLLEAPTGQAVFATPTHSIFGWASAEAGLQLYYDHGDMLLMRCCTQSDATAGSGGGGVERDRELTALLRRLEAVTNGAEAKEILLRRAASTSTFGFHVQVCSFGCSLRQGNRRAQPQVASAVNARNS